MRRECGLNGAPGSFLEGEHWALRNGLELPRTGQDALRITRSVVAPSSRPSNPPLPPITIGSILCCCAKDKMKSDAFPSSTTSSERTQSWLKRICRLNPSAQFRSAAEQLASNVSGCFDTCSSRVVCDGFEIRWPSTRAYSATTPAPPGSFFFKKKVKQNMIAAPTQRTIKVSMYARVAACACSD